MQRNGAERLGRRCVREGVKHDETDNSTRLEEGTASRLAWLVAVGLALNVGLATSMPLLADSPAPEQSIANYEVRFMEEMIDHRTMAVMMGELCLEKAVHQELRTMCEEIIAAQTQEIETMQSWLQEWYGISYEPQMKPGDMQEMEKLAATSGEEFEIMFMEMMIKHHAKAIKQAARCLSGPITMRS